MRRFAPAIAILVITIIAYLPALRCGWVWDDDEYVAQNTALRSVDGLKHIWFDLHAMPQYYPLVFTSFWLEHQAWSGWPTGYHTTNILLHALAAVLLWRLLAKLNVPGAWLAALIFAVHPVHVESVAWVTERKNTLSGVFYLAAALAYLRFADARQWRWYAPALLLFIAALLSKTVTATLPAALLIVLWWKREKLTWRDVTPVAPMFAIGAAMGLLTAYLEQTHVGAHSTLSALERCLVAGRALWFYLWKLALPLNLIPIYPRWDLDVAVWWQWLFPLAAVGVIVALPRRKAVRAAVAFFVITLAPALGFLDVYPFRYAFVADHFQYLASIGLIALVAPLAARWQRPAACVIILLIALTIVQCMVYRNERTYWQFIIDRNPRAWLAHNNLGLIQREDDLAGAYRSYVTAIAIDPQAFGPRFNLGSMMIELGREDRAVEHLTVATQSRPGEPLAFRGLGKALALAGRSDESVQAYRSAIVLLESNLKGRPDNIELLIGHGDALRGAHRLDDAAHALQRAKSLAPHRAEVFDLLGKVHETQGDIATAIRAYVRAVELNAENPERLRQLAILLATADEDALRNGPLAVELAQRAVTMTGPMAPPYLSTLAAAQAELGRFAEARSRELDARRVARLGGFKQVEAGCDARLALYEDDQPLRRSHNLQP